MKVFKYGIVTLIALALIVSGGYYYNTKAIVEQWEDKIYPNISIQGVDVSGKTTAVVSKMLEEDRKYIYNKKINIKHKDKIFTLEYADIKPRYNIEETINEAYRYGKDEDIFGKAKIIKNPERRTYDLNLDYDNNIIDEFLNKLENDIGKEPENASLEMISSGNFKVHSEIFGERLKKDEMKKAILASISDDKVEVVELEAAIDSTNPTVTAEELNKVDSLISSYSTSYTRSQEGRAANVALATKQINGVLLMPGEIFSFNDKTGSRNAAQGYQTAPVIVKNKMEDGLGGGVCQVSTTLYNAVIRANLKTVERRNHSLAPAYVQPGFDATVSENIDYKFKNTSDYPVYIEGYTKNRQVTFNVYSNSSLKNIRYELINEIYEKIPANTEKIDDSTLPKGTIKEEESPHTGYKVRVYLVGKQDDKQVSREIISNDSYKKVDGIIKIGTK